MLSDQVCIREEDQSHGRQDLTRSLINHSLAHDGWLEFSKWLRGVASDFLEAVNGSVKVVAVVVVEAAEMRLYNDLMKVILSLFQGTRPGYRREKRKILGSSLSLAAWFGCFCSDLAAPCPASTPPPSRPFLPRRSSAAL